MQALITDNAINPVAKLRLVILYALRYQKTQASNIASLINLALQNGVPTEAARVNYFLTSIRLSTNKGPPQLVYAVLNIAGADQRQDDLFSTESLLAMGRSALKGLKVNTRNRNSQSFCLTSLTGSRECVHATHTPSIANARASLQGTTERD